MKNTHIMLLTCMIVLSVSTMAVAQYDYEISRQLGVMVRWVVILIIVLVVAKKLFKK